MRRFTLNIDDHSFQIEIKREDERHFSVTINKDKYQGTIEEESDHTMLLAVEGGLFTIDLEKQPETESLQFTVNGRRRDIKSTNMKCASTTQATKESTLTSTTEIAGEGVKKAPSPKISGGILAPMPGKVVKVNVRKGDEIKAGDVVLILEAMKMENEICANHDGTVTEVRVSEGDSVDSNDVMVVMG